MRCVEVRRAEVAYPTGNKDFKVMQPFPSAVSAEEADPFLMCDEFGPAPSKGRAKDPDSFQVGWHPHIGMDIMTYLLQGHGRHADSLGNRNEFDSPGFQWCSVGSGIEHAEGGGTEAGEMSHGFQIWVNVPKERKNDDPKYGTESPENIPKLEFPGARVRLLAGPLEDKFGPFQTAQAVQMADLELDPNATHRHKVPAGMDNCLIYIYRGEAEVSGMSGGSQQVCMLDASDPDAREVAFTAGSRGLGALIFAGKRIREPIHWHGPFVMTSQAELRKAFATFQSGNFPPKRVPWDYKRWASFPASAKSS